MKLSGAVVLLLYLFSSNSEQYAGHIRVGRKNKLIIQTAVSFTATRRILQLKIVARSSIIYRRCNKYPCYDPN